MKEIAGISRVLRRSANQNIDLSVATYLLLNLFKELLELFFRIYQGPLRLVSVNKNTSESS